jgi:preprotein translocase subunit SecG
MIIALTVLHVLMCFAIIGIVLIQSGKGADIGSAFGGAGSQAVFGSMGTPTVVGKITTVVAILFTVTSFTLALLGGERSSSVVREPAPVTAPAAPAAPATPGAAGAPATPAPTTPPAGAPAPAAPAQGR